MPLDLARVRRCLRDCDLPGLFTQELGWDHQPGDLPIAVDGQEYTLTAIAGKRGMVAYNYSAPANSAIPDYPTRRRIERQVARSVHEHILIFTDSGQKTQVWQWVKREAGRPTACREHTYHCSQPGDALIQKLAAIEFTLEEEENLTIVDVAGRTRTAFDVERITRRFYDRFKMEHAAFLKFIKGLPGQEDRDWYASLMLNRLMFVYFIQKKGFLDGDNDYLRNRLETMRQRSGKDKFLSFYRHFLLRLFHQGLGSRERNPELDALLGKVPYLNGGLFDVHELEEHNPEIIIPDKAFEKLFDFFDTYRWHLDERPLRKDDEINPDVLGYIFEKYVNQKQMGAYYTKEDITDYISKNTIIPFLFDAAEKKCAVAFQPDSALWLLLRENPDRYIYPAMRHGVIDEKGGVIPLPKELAAGLDDVSRRGGWNAAATTEFALPTETWREHVTRRWRCLELRKKLTSGEVHAINDLITLNLDICRFAQDVIENCEGPELLRAFYSVIAGRLPEKSTDKYEAGISVLDPTCGSGAFLFAALNILEPIFEACLERMARFLEDADQRVPETVEDAIKTTIAASESSTVEFKSTARWNVKAGTQDPAMEKVIVKTVAALLNTKGGVLLIGVEDDGTVFGLEKDYKTLGSRGDRDGFENWLMTKLTEQFGRDCAGLVAVDFCQIDKKDVCRVVVQASPIAAYIKDGKDEVFCIRVGNSTRELTARETVKYHEQRFKGEMPPTYVPPTQRQQFAGPAKHRDFRRTLDSVAEHPNQRYFILKSIIIGNLFGVDIMEEAVEICKLRLFLKLVAQVDAVEQVEPLPDIDFNIRPGNTLIGFTSLKDVERAMTVDSKGNKRFVTSEDIAALKDVQERADMADRAFQQFRRQQTILGGIVTVQDKLEVRNRLAALSSELDKYAAQDYGIDSSNQVRFEGWKHSYRPFHWFTAFFGVMSHGGFDVIIGNPPWVEYRKVSDQYTVRDYATRDCNNLWAFVTERSAAILHRHGRCGLIVPMALTCTSRMLPVQHLLSQQGTLWVSNYESDSNPGQLFLGVKQNVSILLLSPNATRTLHTTRLLRFFSEARDFVFEHVRYFTNPARELNFGFPKVSDQIEADILEKLFSHDPLVEQAPSSGGEVVYVHRIAHYYIKCFDFVPYFRSDRDGVKKSEDYKEYRFRAPIGPFVGIINSSAFYFYWQVFFDGFKAGKECVESYPCNVFSDAQVRGCLTRIAKQLMNDMQGHAVRLRARYEATGNVEYDQFYPRKSKHIMDMVDVVLAKHYGLSDDEADFLVNYNIKFRAVNDGDESDDS